MSARDPRVLITGASGGLGMELARLYAARGRDLVITARRTEQLRTLKDELENQFGVRVFVIPADLADPAAPEHVHRSTAGEGLVVDTLVNNAGAGLYGEFAGLDFDRVARMYQVNVLAVLRLTQLFLPAMITARRGHIVNVASLGAFFPGPLMSVYFAAKADLCSWTAAIGYELRDKGITMSVVCPGPFKSGFQQGAFGNQRNLAIEEQLSSSRQTAEEVFRGLLKQKELIIPGRGNQIIYYLSRFLPHSLIMPAVFKKQRALRLPHAADLAR